VNDTVTKQVIDAKRLFYFYHVAQAGSFSKAEPIVRAPQPVISRHVHKLEQDLGVLLLERHGRGVRMTPFGEILSRRAETILTEMEEALSELDAAKRQPVGQIRIAATSTVMSIYMPEIVTRFTREFPEVELTAVQASAGEVYNFAVAGKSDISIVMEAPSKSRFVTEQLLNEPMMFVVHSAHPLATRAAVTRRALATVPLVLPASTHGMRRLIDDYATEAEITLQPHLQIDSIALIRAIVERGEYGTILPLSTTKVEFDQSKITVLPLQPRLTRTLWATYLREGRRSAYVDQLMNHVRSVFSDEATAPQAAT
jgi:DNA-binding transcriptional LysR family regulator